MASKIKLDKKALLKSAISKRAMSLAKKNASGEYAKMIKNMKQFKAIKAKLLKKFFPKAKAEVKAQKK